MPTHCPFTRGNQLCSELDNAGRLCEMGKLAGVPGVPLPGHPCTNLSDSFQMKTFLEKEFWAKDLEAAAEHLWVMSTQSSANVNPLHRQRVKGRHIIVTEDPRLHLVWIYDYIFVKPLPKYLLSYRFWGMVLLDPSPPLGDARERIRKAATGFLRTYRYLIQHESDFFIAQKDELRLIPKTVDWNQFSHFLSDIGTIKDTDVSDRYCYGELRLSRLNLYAPFLFGRLIYEPRHGQYSRIFGRLYGPVLYVFAVISTVLNSMQVELAVEQGPLTSWAFIWPVCRWFSVLSLIGTILMTVSFVLVWIWMVLNEWIYAIKCRYKKKAELGAAAVEGNKIA